MAIYLPNLIAASCANSTAQFCDLALRKMLVPVVFVLFVLIRAMDRIFLYRVQKSMQNYTGPSR